MKFVLLIIGTLLSALFVVQLKKGSKYESYIEVLEENNYPLHELYGVGFAWSETKFFPFKGKLAQSLKNSATLLYESQYVDYYANVVWAQTITLVHLFLAVTFLIAGFLYDMAGMLLVVGVFMSIIIAVYCLENMKNTVSARTEECERELPEVVSTMAVLVNSGMVLRDAWTLVGNNGNGAFYELMRKASENMRNGASDADAIFLFGKKSNSTEIKKFATALLQSMEKGGAELSVFLSQQSSELWGIKRQKMLQSGEKAATKLLLPILLIFIGIIIIVMTAAFAGSLF